MRLLLVAAAAAIHSAAGPAEAAPQRAGTPRAAAAKPQCGAAAKASAKRSARARRRAALGRTCARRLVGEARASLLGVPGSFAALAPFAPAAPAAGSAAGPAPAEPAPTPAPPVLPPIYSNPLAVQVQGFEFGLQLSKANVSAGDVRVEFNLARAEDPHNLWLVREDGAGTAHDFDEEPAGAVVARTLALTRGRWTLFCSLDGHEAAGMRATLTVG